MDDYQGAVNSGKPDFVQSVVTKWKRNPKIGALALAGANYTCEIEPAAPTFTSKYSGAPFMEAHHLIPMKMQGDYSALSLDDVGNICCLGPAAHRKVHFAPIAEIAEDLSRLHDIKKPFMDVAGMSKEDLLKIYEA